MVDVGDLGANADMNERTMQGVSLLMLGEEWKSRTSRTTPHLVSRPSDISGGRRESRLVYFSNIGTVTTPSVRGGNAAGVTRIRDTVIEKSQANAWRPCRLLQIVGAAGGQNERLQLLAGRSQKLRPLHGDVVVTRIRVWLTAAAVNFLGS